MNSQELIITTSISKNYILNLTNQELEIQKTIFNDIKTNYTKLNILEKRKYFSFFLYITTNLTIKNLSNFKIKDFNFIFSNINSNSLILKTYFSLFYNDFVKKKNEESYLLCQILTSKSITPNNLKKDIQSILIKYFYYYNFKLHETKWDEFL